MASGGGGVRDGALERVTAFIRRRLAEEGVPSLAVGVAREGEIVWEDAFGWADVEGRVPATAHTAYSLASVSKPVTATGVMLLCERGAVALDRPIDDYLGVAKLASRAGDSAQATVRRVGNHTAGLPLHYHFFPDDEPLRPPPMDDTIRRYATLVTAPGERYQYSNLGFGLLAYVIARRSGTAYNDFMRREVFLPLGMTRTSIGIGPGMEAHAARCYGFDRQRLPRYDFDHCGASAVFGSVHDLLRFGLFALGTPLPDQHAILTAASLAEMQRDSTATDRPRTGYGFGWRVYGQLGIDCLGHDGGMDGVSTALRLVPSRKLAVVALANASTPLAGQTVDEILSALLPEVAEHSRRRAEEQRQGRERAQAEPEPGVAPGAGPAAAAGFEPPRELLGEWRGRVVTYQDELPLTLVFKPGGDVHARLAEQLWTLVNEPALKDGWLSGRFAGDLGIPDAARRPYHLRLDLRLRGDRLSGALIAQSQPRVQFGNALSAWTELEREG